MQIWQTHVNCRGVIDHYVICIKGGLLPIFLITVTDNLKIPTAHVKRETKLRTQELII